MVDVLSAKVRFGDLSFGPFVHSAVFFDLLIQATEEFAYVLGESCEAITAGGGVPYAPIATWGDLHRYPRYEETVVVSATPVEVGDRSVRCEYDFATQSGVSIGRAQIVHVTMTPEDTPRGMPTRVRETLERLQDGTRTAVDIDPAAVVTPAMERDVVFRTPHLEAGGLGYFEDYIRMLSVTLEEYLDAQGASLRELTEPTYPYYVTGWNLTFEAPITFEDRVTIRGDVMAVRDDAVTIAYTFAGADEGDVRIRADLTYGCLDVDGEPTAFPGRGLDVLRAAES